MSNEAQTHFVIYKDSSDEWRWTLVAKNGEKVADSAEGYKRKADCVRGAGLVANLASNAPLSARRDISEPLVGRSPVSCFAAI